MISKSEVMMLLIEACPSYQMRWNEYIQSEYRIGDEQLLYVDIGDFVHHLVSLFKSSDDHEFEKIFDVIERLHINGDELVKEQPQLEF